LIDSAGAETVVVVAGVAGAKVRVYRLHLNVHGTQHLTLQETGTTVLLPVQLGGWIWDHSGEPWLETAVDQGLDLVLADATQTSGIIWWTQRSDP
jgi:hypothetical protein